MIVRYLGMPLRVVCVLALCRVPASAQCERAKLIAPDGSPTDKFGFSVGLTSDFGVISAPFDDDHGSNSGAVYIFDRSGLSWSLELKLTLPDGKTGDGLGHAVALSGKTLLATAFPRYGVYVFERAGSGTWEPTDLLSVGVGYEGLFGWSLGLDGDRAIVGAPDDSQKVAEAGAVFVFARTPQGPWEYSATLTAAEPHGHSHLGAAVAISEDVIVGGAPDDWDLGNWSGSAHVFEHGANGTWSQTAKLLPSDGGVFWAFGKGVAVKGSRLVVGADGALVAGKRTGAAYVFEKHEGGKWVETAKLFAADGQVSDAFGRSVALGDDFIVVGAPWDHQIKSGSAYVFALTPGGTWTQIAKIVPSQTFSGAEFGHRIALDGNTALISAWEDDVKGEDSGSAFIFAVGPDEDGDGVMDACETPGDLNCDGAADALDIDPFVLALTDPDGYTAKYPQCTVVNADCNGDGKVDAFDIDPFVALLIGP